MTGLVSVVCTDERAEDHDDLPLDVARWARLAEQVLTAENAAGELTLTFIDEDDIADLNAEHMGKEGPTDVLSFPLDAEGDESITGLPTLLGDIVISPAVAARQFLDHAGTFDDEIALLVVHGILHILGHDHAERDEAEIMRSRELDHLTALHWRASPPARFRQTHD